MVANLLDEITKLQEQNDRLRKNRDSWVDKYDLLERRMVTLEMNRISPEIVTNLEVEKGKLLVELSQYRRSERERKKLEKTYNDAIKKLDKIRGVLK